MPPIQPNEGCTESGCPNRASTFWFRGEGDKNELHVCGFHWSYLFEREVRRQNLE